MNRRSFLTALGASLAFGWCNGAAAAQIFEAEALRTSPHRVRISWSSGVDPVDIFISNDPSATPAAMKRLATATGRTIELAVPISPRPYFLVQVRGGRQTRIAERLLPLQGGRNFRDLGGYRGSGGKQVRWGRIYRSGVMSALTENDLSYLRQLGISVICDLRSIEERTKAPSRFLDVPTAEVVTFDYEMSARGEDMGRLVHARTRDDAIDAFADAYVAFSDRMQPAYTDLFQRLINGRVPVAFNCSAGKDRTGMASALILSVLGVARETVIADYGLSQVYAPPSKFSSENTGGGGAMGLPPNIARALARLPAEVIEVVRGSDPEIMRRALARIDAIYGSPIDLAKARYGLSSADVMRLRQLYLA